MSEIVDKGDGMTIDNGSRIVEAYWGEYPVYRSEVQGSTYMLEIESIGGTIRLINPLVKDNNNWEGVFNDILIDWGDGTETREYGVKFNTGRFNRDSSYKLEHIYKDANQVYTITITSVEPLLPIGCKLYKILGTLPEDCYTSNELGLLTFSSDYISLYPELEELETHKNTINEISSDLLDLWMNVTNMDNIFCDWIELSKVGSGIFKDNIKSACLSYINTFSNTPKLIQIDDDLLGETNNLVRFLTSMFEGSGITTTINLTTAENLLDATNMYANTKITEYKNNFLSNTPNLVSANGLFDGTLITTDGNGLLSNAVSLSEFNYGFRGTKLVHSVINLTKWSNIKSMEGCFSEIRGLSSFVGFKGDFAKNTSKYTLKLSSIFENSGTNLVIDSEMFELLRDSDKLYTNQDAWFKGSDVIIEKGAFDRLFIKREYTGEYTVTNLFNGTTIRDKNLLDIMSENTGIIDFTGSLSNTEIDFIHRDFFADMVNLKNVTDLFNGTKINFRFRKDMFRNNRKISNWTRSLSNAIYKFTEFYSIDHIIYSDVDIDITEMFVGSDIHLRNLLDISAKCENINASNFIEDNKLHVPVETALRNRNITNKPDVILAENILDFRVYALSGDTINVVLNDKTPILDSITVSIDTGDGFEDIQVTNSSTIVKSVTATENKLFSIKMKTNVSLEIEGGELVAVFGSSGYNKDAKTEILDSPTYDNVKFYDRYTRIYDNLDFVNKLDGYVHPSIKDFTGSTSTGYSNISNKGYLEFFLEGNESISFEEIELAVYPFRVDFIDKNGNTVTKTINSENEINNVYQVDEKALVRVYSNKIIWIKNYNMITGLFGEIPACDFGLKFGDKAPNLSRVGENLLINLTNKSFKALFKNLTKLEHIPSNLLSRNSNVVEFDEMFMNTGLRSIPDYLITNNTHDISCRRMFKNSSQITYVREPICDSVSGRIDLTDMFDGVVTRCWFGRDNEEVFERLWYTGDSKLGRLNDCNFLATRSDIVCIDSSNVNSNRYMIANHYHRDSFTVPIENVSERMIYAGQGVGRKIKMDFGSSDYDDSIKYLTLLEEFEHIDNTPTNKDINEYTLFFNERLSIPLSFNNLNITEIKPWTFIHNDDFISIDNLYNHTTITNQKDVEYLLPRNMHKLKSANKAFYFLNINEIDTEKMVLPENKISKLDYYMAESNISFPSNHFINTNPDISDEASFNYMCYKAANQTETFSIFKQLSANIVSNQEYVYAESGIVNPNVDEFEGCFNLTDINHTFSKCVNMVSLPSINHLSNVSNLSYFANETKITDIPGGYIYSTSDNLYIDYAFSNCKNLFISNKIIDSRTTSRISIDYSLENAFSLIGDDDKIFEGLNYDNTYENRSRVMLLDDKVTFMQEIETFKPNITVTLRSVQLNNLIGSPIEDRIAILWGDNTNTIQDSGNFTEDIVNHTFSEPGRYFVRIMGTGKTFYIETLEENQEDVITTAIKSSFKFGSASEIKSKGLVNMFGTMVSSIPSGLFENLSDKEVILSWPDMFYKFYALSDIPTGIIDDFINIEDISGFWRDSFKDGVTPNRVARNGLISNLTTIKDINNMFNNSNIIRIEDGFFSTNNISITSINNFLCYNKFNELPRTLLNPLTKLTTMERAFYNCNNFIIDDTYADFLSTNTELENINGAFIGSIIKNMPDIFHNNSKLKYAKFAFSLDSEDNAPWNTDNPSSFEEISNYQWSIPQGFFDRTPELINIAGCFAGRKSCISYPESLLDNNRNILNCEGLFYKTSLSKIHEYTIKSFASATTVDVRYMFANIHNIVRNCPKVIKDSLPPTFKTYKMLDGVFGGPTEQELFVGVKTEPFDIQSYYKQEFDWFNMTINIESVGDRVMTCPENVFPLTGYIFDVIWGDGNEETIIADFNTLEEFESRFTHNYNSIGLKEVRIKSPFLTLMKDSQIKSISGTIGEMRTDKHVNMSNVGFDYLESVEDLDYSRNVHLTNLESSYSNLSNLVKIKSGVFDKLVNVTNVKNMYKDSTSYTILDGYAPLYNHMKLNSISGMFEGCTSIWSDYWVNYKPFENLPDVIDYSKLFYRSNMQTTTPITFGNNADISYIFAETPINNVDKSYLDGNIKNYSYAFYKCSKFDTIVGETDNDTLLSRIMGISSEVDLSFMFSETSLKPDSVNIIVSNMAIWKNNATQNINISNMFSNLIKTKEVINDRDISFNIVAENKTITSYHAFANAYINNIGNNAIRLTNSELVDFEAMFRNCFAKGEVIDVQDVFDISNMEDMDFRPTELSTLNVIDALYRVATDITLEYANATPVNTIRYMKIYGNINKIMINTSIEELSAILSNNDNIKIESTELVLPLGNMPVSVRGKLSTNKENYVTEGFTFAKYFGTVTIFDVELGGVFHVRTSSGAHTFNGLFKDMVNMTDYSETLFRSYFKGTDGTAAITETKETFANNISLRVLPPSQLQYLVFLTSVRHMFKGDFSIDNVPESYFNKQSSLYDWYGVFEDCNIPNEGLPSRLIKVF